MDLSCTMCMRTSTGPSTQPAYAPLGAQRASSLFVKRVGRSTVCLWTQDAVGIGRFSENPRRLTARQPEP
eukprot:6792344-Alexandrium_andersonii.AAC.1